jgi:TRAP-type mannitol/chloroaromatic compound transport system substrate-binding protein
MTTRQMVLRGALALAVGGGLLVSTPVAPSAQETVTIRLQNGYPRTLPLLGPQMQQLSERVAELTGGTLRIQVFEPGSLVPMLQAWDAIAAGSLDATFAGLSFWVGKERSLAFFNAVPFGPDASEYLAWFYAGGGAELMDEVVGRHGLKAINCNMISAEGSGWFRQPIESVEDLRGLKMRIAGLGGATLEKLGVSTQILAPGDIYPALERGVIDAAEFSLPHMDLHFGYHEVAKHYYLPGWHQMVTINQVTINRDTWDGLSAQQRAAVETACMELLVKGFAESEALQGAALKVLQEEHGVTLHRWKPEILEAYRDAWNQVVEDNVAADETFKRVWESFNGFREEYALWKQLGYL